MRFAYYPGCSLKGTAKEYEKSLLGVAKYLGIELEEIKDWNCCGASVATSRNKKLSVLLSSRNLLISHSSDIVVACAACFNRLKNGLKELKENESLRRNLEKITKREFNPEVKVVHFLEVLKKDLGFSKIEEKKERNLELKVACYYGCLLLRSPQLMNFDDPEEPRIMEELVEALGGNPVDWSFKTECCGASLILSKERIVFNLVRKILEDAISKGANCIMVACPLCHSNLDIWQDRIQGSIGLKGRIPILYFTELMGLSFGIKAETLGVFTHIEDVRPILSEKKLSRSKRWQG